jgi:gamma-glutamylcyclotransferase (GGCT)/AIG2-like uncharacterized protein YtfP
MAGYKKGTYIAPKKAIQLIAVYGSLRPGMSNERVNDNAEARHLGTATTVNHMNLYEYGQGYFPSVSLEHTDSGKPVVIDLYECTEDNMIDHYDALEGYPSFYNRTKIPVRTYTDDIVEAWIYHIDEAQDVLVTSGDWVDWKTDPVTAKQDIFTNFAD